MVQRWPAVPTAAKRMARRARSRLASSMTMTRVVAAELEDRAAEAAGDARRETLRPCDVEPVTEIERDARGRRPAAARPPRPGR